MSLDTDLADFKTQLQRTQASYDRRFGELHQLVIELQHAKDGLTEAEGRVTVGEQTVALLQSYSQGRQTEVLSRLEKVATAGLQTIFGTDLAVRLEPNAKASMDIKIVSSLHGKEVATAAMDSRGGGVVAVLGFLLRLSIVLLQPGTRKIIALDETFSFVSAEFEERMVGFVSELVRRSGVQAVVVTHHSREVWMEAADVVYEFGLKDGASTVRCLKEADTEDKERR